MPNVMEKGYMNFIFEWLVVIYTTGFTIYSYIAIRNETLSPWIFFVAQVFTSISLSILTYKLLDNMFPPILFKDGDYKKLRITTAEKICQYVVGFTFLLFNIFLVFLSVMYVINFSYPSGTFYLQVIQSVMFFDVILYFLRDSINDYSGYAYCEFYESQNFGKIKYHLLPRTLTKEMMECYNNEFFSGS